MLEIPVFRSGGADWTRRCAMKLCTTSLQSPVRALALTLLAGFVVAAAARPANAAVLAGWDMYGQSNWGTSPLAASTSASNLSVGSLTRASGVGVSGSAAAGGWGGNNWTATSVANAIAANQFATFTVTANAVCQASFSSVSKINYRRSSTGPTSGRLQYSIGSGAFNDIATVSWATWSSGSALTITAIDLTGIPALQNVAPGTTVTFRIVNWGASGSTGTWYVYDGATGSTTQGVTDLEIQGTVTSVGPTPTQVRVETAADGTGDVVPAQNLAQGSSLPVYAVTRDASDTFVANAAVVWSLLSKTGGVVDGDLVPSGDGKSAVFTAHAAGSSVIHAAVSGLTSNDSGTITALGPPTPPSASGQATPSPVAFDNTVLLTVQVTLGANPTSTGIAVTGDLTTIGGSLGTVFYDDGTHGDVTAGDNIYSLFTSVPFAAGSGSKSLPISVTDAQSRSASTSIALVVLSPTALAGVGAASPSSVAQSGTVLLTVQVLPGLNPTSTGITVTGDFSAIGGGSVGFYDDGTNGDQVSGDGVFSFQTTVPWGTAAGAISLPVTVADVQGRVADASIALTVLAPTNPSVAAAATPSSVPFNQSVLLTATVTPGTNPTSTSLAVTGDITTIGGGVGVVFHDDGLAGDAVAGDNIFSFQTSVPSSAGFGVKSLPITVTDGQSRSGSAIIALNV